MDKVRETDTAEMGDVVWIDPPPEGTCINFDIVYGPSGVAITGHPGAKAWERSS